MYLRILLKDLKRKKTMNFILLLFVILSVMFASSSVNNIVSVVNGLDYYFDKAGLGDYFYVCNDESSKAVQEILKNNTEIDDYKTEDLVLPNSDNYFKDGEKCFSFTNAGLTQAIENSTINFFNSDNEIVNTVEKGKMYITSNIPLECELKVGDIITFSIGDYEKEFEYAGFLKDAIFGSEMMNNPRFLMNTADFDELKSDETVKQFKLGSLITVYSDSEVDSNVTAEINGILFDGDRELIKTGYVMNMIVAVIMLVIGIGLIVVSFVILKFTIGFTISEEFHEIGVMKAVGIKNSSIRVIYLVKYLGISVIGAVIGYIAGIPFADMLLSSVSEQMVLGNDNTVIIGIICSIAVVLIILSFCWSSTGKVKKLSPIDAVRSGQTGERFRKRSILRLGKSRLGTTSFLSVNDILSEPKQYGIITAVFTICMLLVILLANTANTLDSPKTLVLLSMTESDVYIADTDRSMKVISGEMTIDEAENEISEILQENNMPADIKTEEWYRLSVSHNGNKLNIPFLKCDKTNTEDYKYTEGTAPQYEDEIAITGNIAKELDVKIGEKVSVDIEGEKREFIVTALFQCFNNLGKVGRLHQAADIPDSLIYSLFSFQADFTDNPSQEVITERFDKLKDIFGEEYVMDARGFVDDCTGVSSTVKSVKNLALILTLMIIAMISVLMERSFIAKEKSEIALQKALGFNNNSIIMHHVSRFSLLIITATVIAITVSTPLTNLLMDPVFSIMGTETKIDYEIKPFEVFVLYPLIMLAVTSLGAWLTAIYTNKIKASDTADI